MPISVNCSGLVISDSLRKLAASNGVPPPWAMLVNAPCLLAPIASGESKNSTLTDGIPSSFAFANLLCPLTT